ncbi:MAG: universal stress protein [Bryobacteraceae bacterium]
MQATEQLAQTRQRYDPRRVLVPVDFSDRSAAAVRWAGEFARATGAEVALHHVLPAGHYEGGFGALGDPFHAKQKIIAADLEEIAARDLAGVHHRCEVTQGQAGPRLAAAASDADLVVAPTHGRSALASVILGSVALHLLRNSPAPVLTGADLHPRRPLIQSILCAVDLTSESRKALDLAAALAPRFDARLFLLHVVEELGAEEGEYARTDSDEVTRAVMAQLQELGAQAAAPVKRIVAGGQVERAVTRQVRELGADLLIIGRGKLASGELAVLGNAHAWSLVRESPCPVLCA